MDYGLCLPNVRDVASAELIEASAALVDRLGWSTVWTTDHLLVEHRSADDYGTTFEAIETLAWVGARHARLRLATSVIVVPMRNAVVLAKELATLDAFSRGRVVAGVGVGWDEIEFGNVGVADRFHVRGAYLDETIRLWDSKTFNCLRILGHHPDWVRCLSWHPTRPLLICGCKDGKVWLWNIRQGQVVGTIEAHRSSVVSVAWSPNGNQFASASEDLAIHIWEVDL